MYTQSISKTNLKHSFLVFLILLAYQNAINLHNHNIVNITFEDPVHKVHGESGGIEQTKRHE